MDLKKPRIKEMYETMIKIRIFEEKAKKLFNKGLIRGPMHSYKGEEAVATGVCSALKDYDLITSTHRGHGHCIAKGGDLKKMMAELLGKETGYCKGKGGSMHIADMDIGILGANGIVGGGLTIATGAALSLKMKKSDGVTVCFFGDGASNQGTFNEALNMASIWDLPVIYVCEYNQYGLTSKSEEVLSVENVSDRAPGYNMPGIIVDGNDVLDVYEETKNAVEKARKGEGPILIEAKTYRLEGHFVGDPEKYRAEEEINKWRKKDPITRFKNYVMENNYLDDKEINKIDRKIEKEIDEAEEFARESSDPDINQLKTDIFA